MTPARRTLTAGIGFALAGGFGYASLYPPLRDALEAWVPGLLITVIPLVTALGVGAWVLWRIQEDPGPFGRWVLLYLILLFLFGSAFALVRGNGSGAAVEVFAGMAGAGIFGGVWAVLKGHRDSLGYCAAIPALYAGIADGLGHGIWNATGGLAGWVLWGMVYGGGLGVGLAACVERMESRPPRNILREQFEAHVRSEGGSGG